MGGGTHNKNGGFWRNFVEEGCIYRRIARRIQYALLVVEKPISFEKSSEGVCYPITLV